MSGKPIYAALEKTQANRKIGARRSFWRWVSAKVMTVPMRMAKMLSPNAASRLRKISSLNSIMYEWTIMAGTTR